MKKLLTSISICIMAVIGIFSFAGCDKKRDYNGVYQLVWSYTLDGDNLVYYDADSDNSQIETYINIEGNKVTEYICQKSSSGAATLLNENIASEVLPEFYITKEGDKEYFTNFTNLNRFIGDENTTKIQRWTYVKVDSLPTFEEE